MLLLLLLNFLKNKKTFEFVNKVSDCVLCCHLCKLWHVQVILCTVFCSKRIFGKLKRLTVYSSWSSKCSYSWSNTFINWQPAPGHLTEYSWFKTYIFRCLQLSNRVKDNI